MDVEAAGMPDEAPVIRTIAMPADTNPNGDIFGGWLMSLMDLAAASIAAKVSRGRVATVCVEAMEFHSPVFVPVFVRDEVSLFGHMESRGRTSIKIEVEAWRRARESDAIINVTEALFVYVAIGEDPRSRPLPD